MATSCLYVSNRLLTVWDFVRILKRKLWAANQTSPPSPVVRTKCIVHLYWPRPLRLLSPRPLPLPFCLANSLISCDNINDTH